MSKQNKNIKRELNLFEDGTRAKVYQQNAPDVPCVIHSTFEETKGEFKGQWARVTLLDRHQKTVVRVGSLIF
jgi:hypothetical protein